MILDRGTYKLIESHFKTYIADKAYVSLLREEIAESICPAPDSGGRKGAVSDPTAGKAMRIEKETKEYTPWFEVIELTVNYFDDEAKREYGDVRNGKGEYIRKVYFDGLPLVRTMHALDISEGTYFNWRRDILNRAAIFASAYGLIE